MMAELPSVGFRPSSFVWSEKEYPSRQLVDEFQHLLPFVAMITQGCCGKDESIQMSDQMLWLRDIAYQRRLVCQDSNGKYYSIPLCYTKEVLPSNPNGSEGPSMSIRDMVLKGIYTSFTFEPGCSHSILRNGDNIQCKDLRTLKIVNTYYERFLVVHSLLSRAFDEPPTRQNPRGFHNNNTVHSKFKVIPLYMPICFVVAVGMSKTEAENFYQSMFNLRKFVDTLPTNYNDVLKQNCGIITFENVPSNGDYEHSHYMQLLRHSTKEGSDSRNVYCTIDDVSRMIPGSGLNSDRSMKQRINRKLFMSSFRAVRNILKKKRPFKRKSNLKNEATPSLIDLGEDSDEMNDDKNHIQEVRYLEPVSSPLIFVPTPLDSREGHVALGVDVGLVLGQLNDMLLSGRIPKSTPTKANVVTMPDILPKSSMVSEEIDYEQVDMLPPPEIHERKACSSAPTHYVKDNVESSHQKLQFLSPGGSCLRYPTLETPLLSAPAAQPITISDTRNANLALKFENIEHGEIDDPSTTGILKTVGPISVTDNPVCLSGLTEPPTIASAKLNVNESIQDSLLGMDDSLSEAVVIQDSPIPNELKCILAKRGEIGLINNSSMEISKKDIEHSFKVKSHDPTVQLRDDSPINLVHYEQEQVHVKLATIQPQAKTKPLIPAKPNKQSTHHQLKTKKNCGV